MGNQVNGMVQASTDTLNDADRASINGDQITYGGIATTGTSSFEITSSSSGTLINSSESLGSLYSHNVSLGDLDDDIDLDAFFTNLSPALNHKVWLNDGSGNFTDSGQSISTGYSLSASLGDIGGDNDFDASVLSVYTVDNVGLVESTGTWTTDVGTGNGLFNNVSGNAKVTDISQTNGYSDSPYDTNVLSVDDARTAITAIDHTIDEVKLRTQLHCEQNKLQSPR